MTRLLCWLAWHYGYLAQRRRLRRWRRLWPTSEVR